jgi:hydroxyethylthiazole kinase-like uncharacterized protein yjeF
MKIFRCGQIKQIDEYTILNEPVASIDLMERAAGKLYEWYAERFERTRRILIMAGPGNNGGDGLALARILANNRYETEVYFLQFSEKTSDDWQMNRKRLEKETSVPFITIKESDEFPLVNQQDVIIDAIFGSGISRPPEDLASEIIGLINKSATTVISIDIPSGLFGEDNSHTSKNNIIEADFTLSFQFPKLSFMFPENEKYTGEWTVLPIGLDFSTINTPFTFLEKKLIAPLLKQRNKFDHKGIFGHGLLAGGSYGKMGAVILGAKAALRTGIGLLTCHIPGSGNNILQVAVPEAMISQDKDETLISGIGNMDNFDAIGIGPGMGTDPVSQKAIHELLVRYKKPLVIDADALNILSLNKEWISALPAGTIITPHPKEFERLAGKSANGYESLLRQMEFSRKHNLIVVLKGAYTSVSEPDGNVWFNGTGNPGMATAGSGDVLTGMILSLLAQGLVPVNAAIAGVYLHGLAGDIAAERSGYESVIASDIISETGAAFKRVRNI